jgi:hypothetical protein
MTEPKEKESESNELKELRARVKELEADAAKRGRSSDQRRRVSGAWNNVADSKQETLLRGARGMTLAWFEAFRTITDSLSSATQRVLDTNHPNEDESSVRGLNDRLASDVADSVADLSRSWADIPARTAEKFTSAFREGDYKRTASRPEDDKKK